MTIAILLSVRGSFRAGSKLGLEPANLGTQLGSARVTVYAAEHRGVAVQRPAAHWHPELEKKTSRRCWYRLDSRGDLEIGSTQSGSSMNGYCGFFMAFEDHH